MGTKLSIVVGFSAGYVLGARAGRRRYDQISSTASRVWHDPRVEERTAQAQEKLTTAASSAAATAASTAASAASAAVSRVRGDADDTDESPSESPSESTPEGPSESTPESQDAAAPAGPPDPDAHLEVEPDAVVYSTSSDGFDAVDADPADEGSASA